MTDAQNTRPISERERALVEAVRALLLAIDEQGDHGSYDTSIIGPCRICDAWAAASAALAAYGDEK